MVFSLELEIFGVAVQRIHQRAKNDTFCEELLCENDFEAVLVNFCCCDYGIPMLLRQFIRLAQGHWTIRQLTKTANFIATAMKKTYLVVYYCWRYKPSFCFFPDINKTEYKT